MTEQWSGFLFNPSISLVTDNPLHPRTPFEFLELLSDARFSGNLLIPGAAYKPFAFGSSLAFDDSRMLTASVRYTISQGL